MSLLLMVSSLMWVVLIADAFISIDWIVKSRTWEELIADGAMSAADMEAFWIWAELIASSAIWLPVIFVINVSVSM